MQRSLALSLCGLLTLGSVRPQIATAQIPGTTATPIQHLVVIFNENISFDHYFGTYPNALNPPGEPEFIALPNTPAANNYIQDPSLLLANPNFLNITGNGTAAVNPFRLGRAQARTADQGHN